MIIDAQDVFHGVYAQNAWTGGTGVAVATTETLCTNVLDTSSTNTLKDWGTGKPLYLLVLVTTSFAATGGAANVTFKLKSDSTANLATSATTHWTSGAIAKGTLVAGYVVGIIPLPVGKTYEQYIGVTFTPDTNDTTSGKFIALLTDQPDAWAAYAKSYTISA